ncbi:recombinase family protein, partial [Listeria monocytogenes]|nr:recombinase family protein [Listeria monocytogenes]
MSYGTFKSLIVRRLFMIFGYARVSTEDQ